MFSIKPVFAAVLGFAIGGAAMAQAGTVDGSVAYRERIAPPPGAVVEVQLLDVSRADAPSLTLSSQRFALTGVPQPFSLTYDDALIDERMSYTVSARILLDEKVLWRSTTAHPVLTRGAGQSVDVMVERMPADASPALLENSKWQVFEMKGRMLVVDRPPEITFGEEGAVGVFSGCNRFAGSVEVTGDSIAFSDKMAGTLMACPPPGDKLERDMLSVLPEVAGLVQNGDQLAFVNAAGVTVMRLQQVAE